MPDLIILNKGTEKYHIGWGAWTPHIMQATKIPVETYGDFNLVLGKLSDAQEIPRDWLTTVEPEHWVNHPTHDSKEAMYTQIPDTLRVLRYRFPDSAKSLRNQYADLFDVNWDFIPTLWLTPNDPMWYPRADQRLIEVHKAALHLLSSNCPPGVSFRVHDGMYGFFADAL